VGSTKSMPASSRTGITLRGRTPTSAP
jgi:hypothetical protein